MDIIFLLTTSKNREISIRNSIGSGVNIYCLTRGELMVEIYKREPKMLIVDLDSFEEQSVEVIQAIVSIEYLPVVYVYSEEEKVSKLVEDQIVIPLEKLHEAIEPLIRQSTIFKCKYDSVMESYNAIDLLNGELKYSFKRFVNMEDMDMKYMTKRLLDKVIAQNLFLKNKPSIVWVLSSKNRFYSAIKIELTGKKYKEKLNIDINKRDGFKFDVYAANGFTKNFNSAEISDISFSKRNFPNAIKINTPSIINFAGFSIGNLILIGMNYKNAVTNYDIPIIKALAINLDLLETIKNQLSELSEASEYTTNALARAAEANDDQTGKHIKRVNAFAKRIAQELGKDKVFIRKLYSSAQMHDVGKIYVDKGILIKPGKLTYEEFEEMKKHTVYGERIIGDSEYLRMSAEIARWHHEKYDGTGYPDGKKGSEIPLAARIVFLADIYDALRSERTYKTGYSHEKAYEIITQGDGRVNPEHFDPRILEVFKSIHREFDVIFNKLRD